MAPEPGSDSPRESTDSPAAVRVGWIGVHEEGIPALRSLLELGVVVGVMTLTAELAARRSAASPDYAEFCRRYAVPLHFVEKVNDPSSIAILSGWDADFVFVIGWSEILGVEALAQARVGTFGAHASLLPRLRGSAPINWALIRGEVRTGNSLMWLDPEVDAGDLVDQREIDISPYDTCDSLYRRVAETNRSMILATLEAHRKGQLRRAPQPSTEEPRLLRRRPSDGLVDWDRPARAVYDFVRALTRPYPGAFSFLFGERMTIWRAVWLDLPSAPQEQPGTIVGALRSPEIEACGWIVACGDGWIGVLESESDRLGTLSGRELADRWRPDLRFANG